MCWSLVNCLRSDLPLESCFVGETGSPRGKTILENWDEILPLFKKVLPNDYSRMLSAISRLEEKGLPREQAEIEAFYRMKEGKE